MTLPLWAWLGLVALLLYVTWCLLLWSSQTALIFPGSTVPRRSPRPAGYEAIERPLPSGETVEALYRPAPATAPGPAPVVIYCHGNGEVVDQQMETVDLYQRLGCGVLLVEYRGYGRAGGRPSEAALVNDAVWFTDRLLERPKVEASRLMYHGRSLGGGVVCQLAARRPPAALVLQSTFTSIATLSRRYGVPGWLLRSPFRSDAVLGDLDCPVLVLHGARDAVVPVAHGRRLAALARHGRYVELTCGHNDWPGPDGQEAYEAALTELLAGLGRD